MNLMVQQKSSGDRDALIDANLRRIYDEMASEELPDRLVTLLEKLRAQDRDAGGSDPDEGKGNQ
ncbi:MAG: NepR family anti-sigma factor [Paracoccaceae bacterium]